jgi:hypothetical protein
MSESDRDPALAPRIDLAFTWRYSHAFGALAPYFDGLRAGRAMATRCAACGRTWFPPRLACPAHGERTQWLTLSGEGQVAAATLTTVSLPLAGRGLRAWLALIALDGADNQAIGRIAADVSVRPGLRVRLAVDEEPVAHPAQAAVFVPIDR